MYKRVLIITILFISLLFKTEKVHSLEIVVITSKKSRINTLSSTELRKIYLKIKIFHKGERIIPVNLPPNSRVRQIFYEKVIGLDYEQLNMYWNERFFHGIEPPMVFKSPKAVLKFIQTVPGSIGYVPAETLTPQIKKTVKIIYKIKADEKNFDNR